MKLLERQHVWYRSYQVVSGRTRIKALGVTGSHTSRELRAIQCGQDMQDEQIATAISFSSAINACAKAFLWQRSIHLLTEMQLNGFSRTQTLAHTRCSMMFHQIRTWMSMSALELASVNTLDPWIQEHHRLQRGSKQLRNGRLGC